MPGLNQEILINPELSHACLYTHTTHDHMHVAYMLAGLLVPTWKGSDFSQCHIQLILSLKFCLLQKKNTEFMKKQLTDHKIHENSHFTYFNQWLTLENTYY